MGNCNSLLFGDEADDNDSLYGKNYAFRYLFRECATIVQVYESFLPATTLDDNCYKQIFKDYSKLNYIKMLATDISASNCLYNWVSNVSSTGTFVKNPAMTSLPTGNSGIPNGWTVLNANKQSYTFKIKS